MGKTNVQPCGTCSVVEHETLCVFRDVAHTREHRRPLNASSHVFEIILSHKRIFTSRVTFQEQKLEKFK